ncbi:MAG TPA: DUF4337 domain-containing protein [Oscillatoriaceae cyanobacterium]
MELEIPQLEETEGTESAEKTGKNKLFLMIAITVALVSAFMAVTKVKDDNICQAMSTAQTAAMDTWAQYQAKRERSYIAEVARNQDLVLLTVESGRDTRAIDKQIKSYSSDLARYEADMKDLSKAAKGYTKQYNALNFKDDQFDMSDATLSLSLAILAIAALTSQRWLVYFSWVIAAFGLAMGVAGLAGLGWHPDWIVQMLS